MAYIGEVDWTSPGYGQLVQFKDSGGISVTDTSVTVSPLVPGTYYLIRVSAVTQSGRGAEVTYHGITRTSTEGKKDRIIQFNRQIRIFFHFNFQKSWASFSFECHQFQAVSILWYEQKHISYSWSQTTTVIRIIKLTPNCFCSGSQQQYHWQAVKISQSNNQRTWCLCVPFLWSYSG